MHNWLQWMDQTFYNHRTTYFHAMKMLLDITRKYHLCFFTIDTQYYAF